MGMIDGNGLMAVPSNRVQTTTRWHSSVQRVLLHMRNHLEEKQSSEELADIAALSRFHFNRVFRQVTGIPPAHFRAALRLERAKFLLLTSDLNVTNVCFEVGYTSLGTFVWRFTESVGMSPRAFRHAAQLIGGVDLRQFCDAGARPQVSRNQRCIEGRIDAPADFAGAVCVGMYDALLPHSRPLQCAAILPGETFAFCGVRDGSYVIAAAGLHPYADPLALLDESIALRVASPPIVISRAASCRRVDLMLRPADAFDPPILAPLPAMLASGRAAGRYFSREADATHAVRQQ